MKCGFTLLSIAFAVKFHKLALTIRLEAAGLDVGKFSFQTLRDHLPKNASLKIAFLSHFIQ